MMEILFRGKRIDGKGWAYGDLFQNEGRAWILIINDQFLNSPQMIEVIPETVGQFTGIPDKNGVKIFRGDIMLLGDGTKRKTVIEYDSLRAQFVARLFDKNSIRMAVSFWSAGEIIGNIHDNPELLEVK